jgi:uncharacterized protein (TIGR02145 family)
MTKFLVLIFTLFVSACGNESREDHGKKVALAYAGKTAFVGGLEWLAAYTDKTFFWNEALNICPDDWHLPDEYEWHILLSNVAKFLKLQNGDSVNIRNMEYWTSSYVPAIAPKHPYLPLQVKIEGRMATRFAYKYRKASALCVKNANIGREEIADSNAFYGPASMEFSEPACIEDLLYVAYEDGSLIVCRDGSFKSTGRKLKKKSVIVDIAADTSVKNLKYLFPCTYGLNGKVFMTGNDFYLYRCKNYEWRGLGYAKRNDYPEGVVHDSLSGESYKTLTVGATEWMAENLRKNTPGSACYDDKSGNCRKYGRLYSSYEDGMCPAGWTLPAKGDWDRLFADVGQYGAYLRSKDGWFLDFKENKDIGFSVYPAGWFGRVRAADKPEFLDFSMKTAWFSYDDVGRIFSVMFDGENFDHSYAVGGSKLYIRCVQKE